VTVLGIDVSDVQGPAVDFARARAAGVAFVICKATEGLGFNAAYFDHDWDAASAAGLVTGAYHFARPDLGHDAAAEARHHLAATAGRWHAHHLPAILDYERAPYDPAWAARWFEAAELAQPANGVLYASASRAGAFAGIGRRLWVAAYPLPRLGWSNAPGLDRAPRPGDWRPHAWQFTDAAAVPGVARPVDASVTDEAHLLDLIGRSGPNPGGDDVTPENIEAIAEAVVAKLVAPDAAIARLDTWHDRVDNVAKAARPHLPPDLQAAIDDLVAP
jgi:GH25 family lysozyme M1 (1,4-beta-N-acetylmuramidase)